MASVTHLLNQWTQGDPASHEELFRIVQEELHRIADRYMRRERSDHTLQTTALVNEAYMRLVDQPQSNWQNRMHFYAISARVMRQILVDHARRADTGKRGGRQFHVPFDEALAFTPEKSADFLVLDEALLRLADQDARKAQVVELRYFGGLEVEEVAQVLRVHPNTVIRDWSLAKAWLKREMSKI
ncbi:MAG: sigma-70 family RNA polymerase sigma factor [Bryobacteraceae bacterium]